MKKLQWVFELLDRVSGPSDKVAAATDRVTKKAKEADSGWRDFVATLDHSISILGSVEGAFSSVLGWIERITSATTNAVHSFGSFVLSVGGERESAITGMTTVLQDQVAAQRAFQDSLHVAQLTPFETADVVRDRTQLILSGFTVAESRVLYAAAADIRSTLNDPGRAQTLMTAFTRIRGEGGLHGRIFEELTAAGIGRARLFEELASQLHHNPVGETQAQLAAWAEAQLHNPAFDANRSISLVLDTIQHRLTHTGLGEFSAAQSGTIGGILSNLASLPHDILAGIDIAHIPGIDSFKTTMTDFLNLFAAGSAEGDRFRTSISHLIDALFGGLFSGSHESRVDSMRSTLDRVSGVIENIARSARAVLPDIVAFVEGFGSGVLEHISSALGGVAGGLETAGDHTEAFRTAGGEFADTIGRVIDSIGRIASSMTGALTGIDSNQPILEQIGGRLGSALLRGFSNEIIDMGHVITHALSGQSTFADPAQLHELVAQANALATANVAQLRVASLNHATPGGAANAIGGARSGAGHQVHTTVNVTLGPGATGADVQAGAAQIAHTATAQSRDSLRRVDLGGNL